MPDTHITDLPPRPHAVLDAAHIGDINGALGTIYENDIRPRLTWGAKLRTLAAIVGPGLIVMVGDNDAGAFATYTQAGQNYGTALLWTLMLLIPVLYVNRPACPTRAPPRMCWSMRSAEAACALARHRFPVLLAAIVLGRTRPACRPAVGVALLQTTLPSGR